MILAPIQIIAKEICAGKKLKEERKKEKKERKTDRER
jgi:hypothetical protein